MKTATIGQVVELRGRQGFITSILDKDVGVWFLCPPNKLVGATRYCWCVMRDLEVKPVIVPLRIDDT